MATIGLIIAASLLVVVAFVRGARHGRNKAWNVAASTWHKCVEDAHVQAKALGMDRGRKEGHSLGLAEGYERGHADGIRIGEAKRAMTKSQWDEFRDFWDRTPPAPDDVESLEPSGKVAPEDTVDYVNP